MVKILTIGDPHFKKDNIEDCNLFIKKVTELFQKEQPDYIVILGDVLHTHETIEESALNKAYEFINLCRKTTTTYVLVGNHDYRNNSQFLSQNHWMNGMKEWSNCIIVDTVVNLIVDDYVFFFVPYVPNGRFIEALSTAKDWMNADAIFCHQEFRGCKMGAFLSEDGDEWNDIYPFIISGHIHSHQRIGNNIYYTGSAMQNVFGESDKNIIPIFQWNSDKMNINEVDLGMPRKKIVYEDITSVENFKIDKNTDNSKIKLSISGTSEEFKTFKKTDKYKELTKSGVKVVFKGEISNITKKSDKILFKDVLKDLLIESGDKYVMEYYKLIIDV